MANSTNSNGGNKKKHKSGSTGGKKMQSMEARVAPAAFVAGISKVVQEVGFKEMVSGGSHDTAHTLADRSALKSASFHTTGLQEEFNTKAADDRLADVDSKVGNTGKEINFSKNASYEKVAENRVSASETKGISNLPNASTGAPRYEASAIHVRTDLRLDESVREQLRASETTANPADYSHKDIKGEIEKFDKGSAQSGGKISIEKNLADKEYRESSSEFAETDGVKKIRPIEEYKGAKAPEASDDSVIKIKGRGDYAVEEHTESGSGKGGKVVLDEQPERSAGGKGSRLAEEQPERGLGGKGSGRGTSFGQGGEEREATGFKVGRSANNANDIIRDRMKFEHDLQSTPAKLPASSLAANLTKLSKK